MGDLPDAFRKRLQSHVLLFLFTNLFKMKAQKGFQPTWKHTRVAFLP